MGVPSKNTEGTPTGARRRACLSSILHGPHHGDFCDVGLKTINPFVQDTEAQTRDVTDFKSLCGVFCFFTFSHPHCVQSSFPCLL